MIKLKISSRTLYYLFILLLIFHMVFVKLPYISNYTNIQRICVILLAILLFTKIPYIVSKINKRHFGIICLYLFFVIYSAMLNKNTHIITKPLWGAITYILMILESYAVFTLIKEKRNTLFIVNTLYYLMLIYVVVNDILLIVAPNYFWKLGGYYFLGNKFSVSYKHCELLVLLIMRYRLSRGQYKTVDIKQKTKFIIYVVISICVAIRVDCMTGVFGIGLLLLFVYIIPENALLSKFGYLISLGAATTFAFCSSAVLSIGAVQDFITSVLGRNATLTGRTIIFANIPRLMSNHWLFGYGYGSSYETWMGFIHYPNSQNGLIDCIVEQGILAVVLFIVVIVMAIEFARKSDDSRKKWIPVVGIIYMYTLLASVEITMGITYIAWTILLTVIASNNPRRSELCNQN